MLRKITDLDAEKILHIYQQGLDRGEASFESTAPNWSEWKTKYLPACRLAWEEHNKLLAWASLSATSPRPCYKGVAEVSIYVDSKHQGCAIGARLMAALIEASEQHGIWTLYSSIFPENKATLKLHLNHGFRKIGYRERIAQKNGAWRDTLLLERRSTKVGN